MYKLLQKTRERAKQMGLERLWIMNEFISATKDATSPKIDLFSESDLEKII